MIACCHPGKIGDALYTLPTLRELSKIHNCKIDFYTSTVCTPIIDFLKNQSCINDVIIPENYYPCNESQGVQPWFMDVDEAKYKKVYQLGFKTFPDCPLPEFIALTANLDKTIGNNIYYEYKECPALTINFPYVVIAPGSKEIFKSLYTEISTKISLPIFVVGSNIEYIPIGYDYTHLNFNDMAFLISRCKLYLGTFSSPLVIANGFNVPKIIAYTQPIDMSHTVYKPQSHYLFEPTVDQLFYTANIYL